MSEAKCPACRGSVTAFHAHAGARVAVEVKCRACDWRPAACVVEERDADAAGASMRERVAPLAYFDPRPRLPTEAEEAAHRERHGPKAGWSVRIGAVPWFARYPGSESGYLERCERESWQSASRINPGHVESYPHVDGRPVRGPEGW